MNYGQPIKPNGPRPPNEAPPPGPPRSIFQSFLMVIGVMLMLGSGLCTGGVILSAAFVVVKNPNAASAQAAPMMALIALGVGFLPFLSGLGVYRLSKPRK
jgi:hypothetical protein